MRLHTVSRRSFVAVLVVGTAAMIFYAWIQVILRDEGWRPDDAKSVAYLIVPLIMLLLLAALWKTDKAFLRQQLQFADLTWRIAIVSVILGACMRVLWWSQAVAGIAIGLYPIPPDETVQPFTWNFSCGPMHLAALGLFSIAVLTPLIEEFVHRAYVMSYLKRYGPILTIFVSSLIFMVMHSISGWWYAFYGGVVMATLYWYTGSLWASLIMHMSANAIARIDWYCSNIGWVPSASSIPLTGIATIATTAGVCSLLASIWLVRQLAREAAPQPREPGSSRVPRRRAL